MPRKRAAAAARPPAAGGAGGLRRVPAKSDFYKQWFEEGSDHPKVKVDGVFYFLVPASELGIQAKRFEVHDEDDDDEGAIVGPLLGGGPVSQSL